MNTHMSHTRARAAVYVNVHVCVHVHVRGYVHVHVCVRVCSYCSLSLIKERLQYEDIGKQQVVGSLNCYVSFEKEPYNY